MRANAWSKEALLDVCKQRGWLKARERQRTDSTHVLARIRAINRLMGVGEAMRFAPGSLAVVAPDWLLCCSDACRVERYGHRIEESRLPKSEGDRLVPSRTDWRRRSQAIDIRLRFAVSRLAARDSCHRDPPADLGPKLRTLRTSTSGGEKAKIFPLPRCLSIPLTRLQAHRGKKRTTLWTGYKVHLTETCEQTLPHLITHVATTPAPKTDEAMTQRIQEELHRIDIPPEEHVVDAGYVSARVFVNSRARFGIEVVGPVSVDTQWQAHTPGGIDAREGRP